MIKNNRQSISIVLRAEMWADVLAAVTVPEEALLFFKCKERGKYISIFAL